MNSPWLHRFSVLLSVGTLFLIFVGGLVTTTDSGLAVPDWPLSYGQLMPPMVGGILYEHGHRMVAATIGFLTLLLAIFSSFQETRSWVRRVAWGCVGIVVFQGLLGGLTVLFRLPKPISVAHACLAQTFFCLVVSLAVWTSSFWRSMPFSRQEPARGLPLHRLSLAMLLALYVQLLLGALLRHTGRGLVFHLLGGAVVTMLGIWLWRCLEKEQNPLPGLLNLSRLFIGLVAFQMLLGFTTYFLLGHRFDVIPPPFQAHAIVTLHVMMGALLLGMGVIVFLVAYRTRPENTPPFKTTLSDYFELTKPGISCMAGATALAGFVLGSHGDIDVLRLIHTCIGTLFVAAGAGTLNMLFEVNIDSQMLRTQRRPLPSGRLNPGEALFLGALFSVVGVLYLSWAVNLLTAFLAGFTLSVYLYAYTPLKKMSAVCVSVGAVAGALPPVMGWAAASGRLGLEALVLFAILFFWQFPHFLSLAWLYKDDYARAGLHMLPDVDDKSGLTAVSVLIHSLALLIVSCVPSFMGLTGSLYLFAAMFLGGWMAFRSFLFFRERSKIQARGLFVASILYMPLLVVFMVIKRIAPF